MGTIDIILCAFGALLIVTIVAVLVRIYYIIQQQGLQISVLLKNEQALQQAAAKEGYTPWLRYAKLRNQSQNYANNLLPENKQLKPGECPEKLVINNTRAMQPCHALTEKQLGVYAACEKKDGLAGHSETATNLGITTEDSLKAGPLQASDFATNSNYNSTEDNVAVDQRSTGEGATEEQKKALTTGNPRINPQFLGSMTEGVKQANESSKERFRFNHMGGYRRNY